MKHIPVAGKALTLLFTAAFPGCLFRHRYQGRRRRSRGCRRCSREPQPQRKSAKLIARPSRAAAAQRELEQAAMAAGTVFYFDFDSSTLKPAAQAALDAHIALLKTNDRSVRLEGHTDERGTRDYNMALGERRANAVRDYMVVNGVASYRIETSATGKSSRRLRQSGESNWSQNRRVELK
jgi:peptidoglycan-associated lipoprotein